MPITQLRERARASHPMHTLEAAHVFVDRALDMDAETRLWHRHANPGYQPFSPTATIGEHPGGSTAAAEPLAIMYDKYRALSAEHKASREFIEDARLHPRQLIAVLIRAAKSHPRTRGDLCRSYDDIARDPAPVAQILGFGPVSTIGEARQVESTRRDGTCRVREEVAQKPLFKNGMAIKNAARDGRAQLVMLAQV
ncbi:hypothetical protein [Halomonas piscis]|uniref:hypothetical protein n=1 Tax=Halomonas piscis TaxID=3031727 RepID=UPI002896B381|nr:hypothetical protein [Halomonas piscis]